MNATTINKTGFCTIRKTDFGGSYAMRVHEPDSEGASIANGNFRSVSAALRAALKAAPHVGTGMVSGGKIDKLEVYLSIKDQCSLPVTAQILIADFDPSQAETLAKKLVSQLS